MSDPNQNELNEAQNVKSSEDSLELEAVTASSNDEYFFCRYRRCGKQVLDAHKYGYKAWRLKRRKKKTADDSSSVLTVEENNNE